MVLLANFSSSKNNTKQHPIAQKIRRLMVEEERKILGLIRTKIISLLTNNRQKLQIPPRFRKMFENSKFSQCPIPTTRKFLKYSSCQENRIFTEKINLYFPHKATPFTKHENKILINLQHIFHTMKFSKHLISIYFYLFIHLFITLHIVYKSV